MMQSDITDVFGQVVAQSVWADEDMESEFPEFPTSSINVDGDEIQHGKVQKDDGVFVDIKIPSDENRSVPSSLGNAKFTGASGVASWTEKYPVNAMSDHVVKLSASSPVREIRCIEEQLQSATGMAKARLKNRRMVLLTAIMDNDESNRKQAACPTIQTELKNEIIQDTIKNTESASEIMGVEKKLASTISAVEQTAVNEELVAEATDKARSSLVRLNDMMRNVDLSFAKIKGAYVDGLGQVLNPQLPEGLVDNSTLLNSDEAPVRVFDVNWSPSGQIEYIGATKVELATDWKEYRSVDERASLWEKAGLADNEWASAPDVKKILMDALETHKDIFEPNPDGTLFEPACFKQRRFGF
jgi:hypothetical protein